MRLICRAVYPNICVPLDSGNQIPHVQARTCLVKLAQFCVSGDGGHIVRVGHGDILVFGDNHNLDGQKEGL